ncbi:DUF58 domain-containing protein [Bacillaceae bacterium]
MKRAKSNGRAVLFLVAAAYCFAKFQGGFASWFLFYGAISLALYVLLTYFAFTGLRIERRIKKSRLRPGETLEVEMRLSRSARIPVPWLVVWDRLPNGLRHAAQARQIVFPWFKKNVTVSYRVPAVQRGVYVLQDIECEFGDLFGFLRRRMGFSVSDEVIVYPAIQPLAYRFPGYKHDAGRLYGQSVAGGDGTTVASVRDYVPGDKLSRIHWKASARSLAWKTKEFAPFVVSDCCVLFDASKQSYALRERLFERAVSLAASLVCCGFVQRWNVRFLANLPESPLTERKSVRQGEMYLLESLARLKPAGEERFPAFLRRQLPFLEHETVLLIVTPALTEGLVDVLAQLSVRKRKTELFWVRERSSLSSVEKAQLDRLRRMCIPLQIVDADDFSSLVKRRGEDGSG